MCLGLFAIMRPEALTTAMDKLANPWKRGVGIPTNCLFPRIVVGGVGILGSALFVYIACVALGR
jgi:hypothetical protein